MLFLLSVLTLFSHNYALISPTNIVDDTDYYVSSQLLTNSQSLPNFQQDIINCTASTCHVQCDVEFGCKDLDIHVRPSGNVIIECNQNQSCAQMHIDANTATMVDLTCNSLIATQETDGACHYISLRAQFAESVSVFCNDYDCVNAFFYARNAGSASFHFNGMWAAHDASVAGGEITQSLEITLTGPEPINKAVTVGTMEGELTINCDDYDSCKYLNVNAEWATNKLTMNCNEYSCRYTDVHCPKTSINAECNVRCLGDYACDGAQFYINNHFTETIDLQCGTSNTACVNSVIRCNNNQGMSTLEYGSTWECGNHQCCPFEHGSILCPSGEDCVVDCGSQDCAGYYIDGTAADSLVLNCNKNHTCEGTAIYCPLGHYTSCVINCPNDAACQYAAIDIGSESTDSIISNFALNCTESSSCDFATITAGVASIQNVDINCEADQMNPCIYLSANFDSVIDTLSVNCHGCRGANVVGQLSNEADITCRDCSSAVFSLLSTASDVNVDIVCAVESVASHGSACDGAFFNISGYTEEYGYHTNNLTMTCGELACRSAFELYGENLHNVDMHCSSQESCHTAKMDFSTSDQLNLNCDGSFSCYESDIHCPMDINSCNILCTSSGTSCDAMTIGLPYTYIYNNFGLSCPDAELAPATCDGITFECDSQASGEDRLEVSYFYNASIDQYECDHYGLDYCCPFHYQTSVCDADIPCGITCVDNFCREKIINGLPSTHLTVNCGNGIENTCEGSSIYCPIEGCNINCIGKDSCRQTQIFYEFHNEGIISVHCKDYQACYDLIINADYVDDISFTCEADNRTLNGYVCNEIVFNAQYANFVTIFTVGDYASHENQWNINNAGTVVFTAEANVYASTGAEYFHAENAGSVVVNCKSVPWAVGEQFGLCNNYWYLPYDTIFNCYGKSCADLSSVYFQTSAAGMQLNVYSCARCSSVANCIDKLTIYCGDNYEEMDEFTNKDQQCTNNCGCDDLLTNNGQFYLEEGLDNCPNISSSPIIDICNGDNSETCVVDCNTIDCKRKFIDGSSADYLQVSCGGDGDYRDDDNECGNTFILCPDGGCTVNCTSCTTTEVMYKGQLSDEASVIINCIGVWGMGPCYYLTLDARNAYQVMITSDDYTIRNSEFYVTNVNDFVYNGYGDEAMQYTLLYGPNVNNMELNCRPARARDRYTCDANQWYLSETAVINCWGKGCHQMGTLYFESEEQEMVINVNGCDQCNSTEDCLNDFNLVCGSDYETWHSVQNEDMCTVDSSDDCGCYELFSDNVNFVQNGICRITGTPTTKPTSSPTQKEDSKDGCLRWDFSMSVIIGSVIYLVLS